MKPGKTLRGKVVDNQGIPVQGAVVSFLEVDLIRRQLTTRTGKDGMFQIRDIAYGDAHLWFAHGDWYADKKFYFDENSGVIQVSLNARRSDSANEPPPPQVR